MRRVENGLINRHKLTAMLDSFEERIIYVCAPAGHGKTIAVRQWLDHGNFANAVLSLDEYDNETEHFCKSFCAALFDCQPKNDALRKIVSHPAFDNAPDEFTVRALTELEDSGTTRLVIDDLHFVDNERLLCLLAKFLYRLPESFRIVLISRNDLPAVFSDFWLKGSLARVTANDLRFNRDDIMRLYEKRGCPIIKEKADEVFRFTDGWAIAISALLLSDADLHGDSIKRLDEFILANVWNRLDKSTRSFILKTSVVGELTPPLCKALTDEPNCEDILEYLVRHNVFISRNRHGVYQYHRLFLEFLHKLPELRKEEFSLLEKAGYWYLDQKDFYSAIKYFVQCESQKGIIKSFIFFAVIDRKNFIVDRLLPILHLPIVHATAEKFPFIYATMAWCAFAEGDYTHMADYADMYYEKQFSLLWHDLRLAFYILFMRLVDFRVTIYELMQLVKKVPKALVPVKHGGVKPSIGIINQYMPLMHRGTRDFSECAIPDANDNITELLSVIGYLFGDEANLLAECIKAGLLYEQGHLDRAYKHALAANSEIKKHFATETKFCAMSILVYVFEALGQQVQAEAYIELISDMIEQDSAYFLNYNFKALRVRLRLENGEIKSAHEWLTEHAIQLYEDIDFYRLYGHLTTCRAYITNGEYDKAVILLSKALKLVEAYQRPLDIIEVRILLAIAYRKKKRNFQDDAIRHLEKAVSLAYTYGYSQAFVNEGAELSGMLLRLQRRIEQNIGEDMPPASYIKKLHLKALEHPNSGLTSGQAERLPKFTDKQKEVMQLMCEGKSYREITHALGITRPTLRSHISAIYAKLDVTSEIDAIRKIDTLGLLGNE